MSLQTPDQPYPGPVPDRLRHMLETVNELIASGASIYFKFTCAGCGARQTFDGPNKLYLKGSCEECQHVTDIFSLEAEVNYLLVAAVKGKGGS